MMYRFIAPFFYLSALSASLTEVSNSTYPYTLPQLPYPYDSLEPTLDTRTMHLHHDHHHQTYVDNLNKALNTPENVSSQKLLLIDLIKKGYQVPPQIRNNAGGHWNHTFFWDLLTNDPSKHAMPDRVKNALIVTFGSVNAFQERFKQAGLSRLGSGWVWLIKNRQGNLEIVTTPNQDNPMMNGIESQNSSSEVSLGIPLLTCDLWEHAYYLKYTYQRNGFLDNFWNLVNWQFVDELMEKEGVYSRSSV